jgi:dipeptidyl aminopeptidase/acylaminoacyl peptidase
MHNRILRGSVIAAMTLLVALARADEPPISAFARSEYISGAAISPDGRYLAVLTSEKGIRIAMVKDLSDAHAIFHMVMSSATDNRFFIEWCRWATSSRLLCGLRGRVRELGAVYVVTRLAAVDADGKHLMVLVQGNSNADASGQFQDEIVDWSPGKPDTILIAARADTRSVIERQADETASSSSIGPTGEDFPSLFELNVVTGKMQKRMQAHPPLQTFLTDRQGQARLGFGVVPKTDRIEIAARDVQTGEWRPLMTYEAFTRERILTPIAVCNDNPDCAYALGEEDGRDALWRVDLTGKGAPVIEFSHPAVDIERPLFSNDGRLLGVEYETDRPFLYSTDPDRASILRSLKAALPDAFVVITGGTRDGKRYIARTTSDVDAGTYYLLDVEKSQLTLIGTPYPELDRPHLGRMQSISYPARDGTSIPGYLTVPPGLRAEHLPLIVMPHGGPIARDHWMFDFLRAFLVSRGYAVLQMNFRGSSGYGGKWFFDAHQDWGGLTYSDIVDGARWAVQQGITDPGRLCVVGWSFGGYAALLGAVRDGDLFHCSVSIAGISDLSVLESEARRYYLEGLLVRAQVGTDAAKLKADSPRNHADDVHIPVLMLHGDSDAQASVEQSKLMDHALTKAGKAHEFILIPGADHQMSRESDRTTMLTAIERFLATNLGPGAKRPSD